MTSKLLIGLAGALALAAAPLTASATTYTLDIVDLGLDGGQACSSTSGACTQGPPPSSTLRFVLDAPTSGFFAATGTITIDTVAETIDIDITVASYTFEDFAGAFNGIDELVFTNVNYSGTVTYSLVGGNPVVDANQNISVSGTLEQKLLGATVVAAAGFGPTAARVVSGQCGAAVLTGDPTQCGFIFGPGGPYTIGIGSTPQNVRFVNTFNVVVPEPASIGLVVIGLGGLALAGRRRAA